MEEKLAQGFRTFKIKVGKDVDADLARLAMIQKAVDGRVSGRGCSELGCCQNCCQTATSGRETTPITGGFFVLGLR